MQVSVPLPLARKIQGDELTQLVQEGREYAYSNGLVMRNSGSSDVTCLPFCLLPFPFPKEWFAKAKLVQTALNLLMYRVSRNTSFLRKCLGKICHSDEFIRKLMLIHEDVLREGYVQDLSLGIFRMDYMLHSKEDVSLKQVEMNTIASSSIANTCGLYSLQKHILKCMSAPSIDYPDPGTLLQVAEGLVAAWKAYDVETSSIVFLVEEGESNFSDQRRLEYEICAIESSVRVIRCTLQDVHQKGHLNDRKLFIGNVEVGVVYYRAGYAPCFYPTEDEWSARLILERSSSIQCPNVPLQLAGTKKVQQELSRPGVLESFLFDFPQYTVDLVSSLFAGQYSLDADEEGEKTVVRALANPELYVMKPQREGGGNNIFGDQIPITLNKISASERDAFVLMDLIAPPAYPNYVVRGEPETVSQSNLVGELGIFGVILGSKDMILDNRECGHLLRCKAEGSNEGGIGIGIGSLNLPYLI